MTGWVNLGDYLDDHTEAAASELARMYGTERRVAAPAVRTYPCGRCGVVFDTSQSLAGHVSTTHRIKAASWPCRHCDSRFHTQGGRRLHERTHT